MLRLHLRLVARVVLVALLAGVVTPVFGGLHAESDAACADNLGLYPSHHQTTQIETIRPSHGDGHCAICHLQRAMNGAADDAKRFVAALEAAETAVAVAEWATIVRAPRGLPSRAPPSFL